MNEKKKNIVKDIKDFSNNAILAGIIEYKGSKSLEMKYLRQEFYKNNITLKVVKNTLAKIALKNTINENLINDLKEQNLLIFSKKHISLPIKIINNFVKKNKYSLKIKKICLDGKLVENKNINLLLNITNKNTAIYNLIITIKKPTINLLNLVEFLNKKNKI